MKSWDSDCRLAAVIFVLALFGLSSAAFAAVGRTVGTYQVSATGAATYTIPIWAPRGPNGLQPQIALTYDSQTGTGYLGVGWSLSGLSSIYRCNQTYAQDPAPAPVTLTMSDVFCMDGQRLRLTGGTYGDADSTYQTEVANFANVTAYGSAGNGPAYFEVQGRDGRTYEYGNGGGSQVLANGTAWVWWLDKITDRAGNTLTISYTTQDNTAVPATISWTPSSYGGTTYAYTMQFGYGTNAPQSSIYGYVGGTPFENTSLLTSISVEYTGTIVKNYVLTYAQSPTTGRDEITQVQECASAGTTSCLAPTQFTYQSGQVGVSTSATTAISAAGAELKVHNDFNGDGLNDLAYCNGGSPNIIYVEFASASGYGSPVDTGITCNAPLYGDLTGSGKDGILVPNGTDWWYYTWNGSSFSGEDTGLAYDSTAYQYVLADVNGDGLPDLISGYLTRTTNPAGKYSFTYKIYVRLNTGAGGSASFSSSNNLWYGPLAVQNDLQAIMIADTDFPTGADVGFSAYGTLKALDFNGDGRQDIALETITPSGSNYVVSTYELISGSSSFSDTLITTSGGTSYVAPTFLDFNSDACTDYVFNSVIYISGCNGTVAQQVDLDGANIIGAMDWNGDGQTDILVQNGSTIGVYLSEGDGVSALQSTSIPYSSSSSYFALDANGDGLDELGVYSSSGAVSYYLHDGAGQKPDLLSSVTDGYGNYAKPAYVSMAQTVNSTYFEWNDAEFPYQNYMGPLYLVNQTTFSDPSNTPNGTYQQTDFYSGAWTNLQGRGFAGFANFQVHDSRNGTWTTYGYGRAFPYTGMLNAEVVTQNDTSAETIYNRSYTLSDTVLDSTDYEQQYFPYVSSSREEDYEVGGTENGELITTKTGSYSYDGYGNLTSASQTVTDNDPGSPYDGDSWTTSTTNTPDVDKSTWCLALLTESQVSYSASNGSASVTRTRQYTPDTTNCRYTEIITEPSSGSYKVTEALGYDDFGNINSDTVTGTGMTARVSSANWGTTGQFPMSVTDATGATTQFNYNFSYGLVSSETDPNGLTTSWQYGDGFGRLTQETHPDGTYITYAYNGCADYGGCLMGANTLALGHTEYNTNGSIETDGSTYYDELERPILWNDMMLSGGYSQNEVRYDSLGRIAQRAAPCTWSGSTTDPCPYWTTMAYDILNRVTQVQRPINQNDSTLQTTSYAYAGDTTTITDPNENTRTLIKDVNGWLRQTKDALGYAVILGYDAAGAKNSVTDSLGNTLWTGTYAYGISAFLIGESDVDRGTWGYTVDALGERTAWTDPKGQQFYESYDALSRPLTRTEPDLFTQWTWGSSAASHNIGKLASVCTGTGSACSSSDYSESETYDSLGRPYQRAIAIPSMGTYTYTWQYNATTGLLNTLTYPTGSSGKALELQYAYQNGILQSITDILDSPNVTIWQAGAQNPAGQITQDTLGNGLVTSRAYDAVTHWLSSVQSGPGGGASIQNLSFLYDEAGNVTQRQDGIYDLTEDFYYDNDYRLSYSTLGGTQNLSMTYDPMGNITNKSTVSNNATWTYDSVHLHQVREAGSTAYEYTYDANGNMTSWAGEPITWTSYNYPTKISDTSDTFTFAYAPDRSVWLEVQTGGAGTTTYRLGSPLMSIVVGSGATTDRNYIYAGNQPVAIDERTSASNTFYYLLTDHQGSISGITNSSGQVVINESFHPDGQRRNPATWTDPISSSDVDTIQGISPRGYTFKETLEYMNLIDFGGRVEDVFTGRFVSADPNIPDQSDPQSYNRYSYTVNNPLTYVDPTGFDEQPPVVYEGGPGAPDGAYLASTVMTLPPVIITPPFDPGLVDAVPAAPTSINSGDGSQGADGPDKLGSSNTGTATQPAPPQQGKSPQPQSNPASSTTLPAVTITATSQTLQTVTVSATALPEIPSFNLSGALSFALNVGGQFLAVRIGQGPMAAQYGNAASRLVQTFAPNVYISPPMAEFEPWWEVVPQAPYGPDFAPTISYGH